MVLAKKKLKQQLRSLLAVSVERAESEKHSKISSALVDGLNQQLQSLRELLFSKNRRDNRPTRRGGKKKKKSPEDKSEDSVVTPAASINGKKRKRESNSSAESSEQKKEDKTKRKKKKEKNKKKRSKAEKIKEKKNAHAQSDQKIVEVAATTDERFSAITWSVIHLFTATIVCLYICLS